MFEEKRPIKSTIMLRKFRGNQKLKEMNGRKKLEQKIKEYAIKQDYQKILGACFCMKIS